MKKLKKIRITAMIIMIVTLSFAQSLAQEDKNLVKDETRFCIRLTSYARSLDSLDKINENSTMDEFRTAYKNANYAWNNVQKEAAKLEKVEIKEAVEAYNKLVDAVNNIDGDTKTSEATSEINKNIDAIASEINAIMSIECQKDNK